MLGSRPANRWDRVTVVRVSYLITVGAVAGIVFAPGPAIHPFVILTSVGPYVPFSSQVTLAQDHLPSRVGTASGITLGPTVSIGGLAGPVIGSVADATSLQTALAPLILMPALSWLLHRTMPEPALPEHLGAPPPTEDGTGVEHPPANGPTDESGGRRAADHGPRQVMPLQACRLGPRGTRDILTAPRTGGPLE